MKKTLTLTALLFAFALNGAAAQEICKRHVKPEGGFSFCLPEGWSIEERPGAKFKILVGPRSDIFTPNINIIETDVPISLINLVEVAKKQLPEIAKKSGDSGFKVLDQSEFVATSKQIGIKVAFQAERNGISRRTTQYFFSGKGNKKLIFSWMALEKESEVLDPIFDRSMKTLQIEK